ncbi:recombination protein NinG [Candidatus Kaiserbacteria bacterium]|nr:recombination protein NinG [Candidatus Kaiserbacteria bacterium]
MSCIKRDKRDDVFSRLVRERAGWCCEHCGKYYPEGNRQGLHCSHLFSRRHRATRWDPHNCFAHCFSCHQYLGGNPVVFADWAEKRLGAGMIDLLREKAHSVIKLKKPDLEELYKHLKAELKAMESKRAGGERGRIEFAAWI